MSRPRGTTLQHVTDAIGVILERGEEPTSTSVAALLGVARRTVDATVLRETHGTFLAFRARFPTADDVPAMGAIRPDVPWDVGGMQVLTILVPQRTAELLRIRARYARTSVSNLSGRLVTFALDATAGETEHAISATRSPAA